MHRIYVLLPSLENAREMVDEFRDSGVEDDRIHLVSKQVKGSTDLPEASVAEASDVVPSVKRGVVLGAAAGLLAGIIAVIVLPVEMPLALAVIVLVSVVGAGIGSWAAGLVGVAMDREPVAESEDEMTEGAVLMMLDVPDDEVEAAKQRVLESHPEARIQETEHLTSGVES